MGKNLSDYDWEITGDVLHIIDLNLGRKTVTNNATEVINEITESIGDRIRKVKIVYRDSEGIWDGIKPIWGVGTCVGTDFYHIGEIDLQRAIDNAK